MATAPNAPDIPGRQPMYSHSFTSVQDRGGREQVTVAQLPRRRPGLERHAVRLAEFRQREGEEVRALAVQFGHRTETVDGELARLWRELVVKGQVGPGVAARRLRLQALDRLVA